jgi:purine-binding chemotaxis protein CheW
VLGVLNLRGVIVPIVDLRLRLGVAQPRFDANTVVIVMKVGTREFGLVVDGVDDVLRLQAEQLRPMPAMSSGVANDLLRAIATVGERMLLLIDVDKLMRSPALGLSG